MLNIQRILKKINNHISLNKPEVDCVISGYLNGNIDDEDMTCFLSAIMKNGLSPYETYLLTIAMQNSGEVVDISRETGFFVDKHSSGGVSDTTSIAIMPILACVGIKILKMSGRSLGHTGGTIDKIEIFKGYDVEIPIKRAIEIVRQAGGIIIAQSSSLVPADKQIYTLRDKTNNVESIPLIASSIMSKKLASGADFILLDVKYGNGALVKNFKDAKILAKLMCDIGKFAKKHICAIITDMNQPLGNAIGDVHEVAEVQRLLKGEKSRLYNLVVFSSAKLMQMVFGGRISRYVKKIKEVILSGSAYDKLKEIIEINNGKFIDVNKKLITLKKSVYYFQKKKAYVYKINTKELGNIAHKITTEFGNNAGIYLHKKIGDKVIFGESLFDVYATNQKYMDEIFNCFEFKKFKVCKNRLIKKIIN